MSARLGSTPKRTVSAVTSKTNAQLSLAVAFVRSPYAHARITGVDVGDTGRLADPLPLPIPHPDLTQPRTQYALAHDEVNHVGGAIVMVVERYVAEDVADRTSSTTSLCPRSWASTPPGGRAPWCTPEVPGNVAAITNQELGDARAAIAAAPRVLEVDLEIERARCCHRSRGAGVHARWDADGQRLRIRPRPRPPPGCGPPGPTSSSCPTSRSR